MAEAGCLPALSSRQESGESRLLGKAGWERTQGELVLVWPLVPP